MAKSPTRDDRVPAGPAACAPPRPDWTVDQHWERYSDREHAVWQSLYERQCRLLPGRACDDYIAGLRALPMGPDHIPDFRQLSEALMRRTGWQVVAVPGLVPDEVFFEHLAHRRFPAGQFIRREDQLDYLEEPDVFHDVFGHVPMLMNPVMADFVQAYGKGGLRARGLGVLAELARVYWYTVEFGLVSQSDGLRIYGSGILSSSAETRFALEDTSPHRVRFALPRVMRTRYRIDDFQGVYFVLDNLTQLLDLARIDFAPIYREVAGLPALDPSELAAGDQLIWQGTGAYHQGRPAP